MGQRTKYTHRCSILVEQNDFNSAELFVNDVVFAGLPLKTQAPEEEKQMCLDVKALELTYNIALPQKVNAEAPVGVVAGLRALADGSNDHGAKVLRAAAVGATVAGAGVA